PIPHVTSNSAWEALKTGAYCNYNTNSSNADTYGRLYNWYAVNDSRNIDPEVRKRFHLPTDSRNIAPEGWHVPSDAEWKTLVDYLGGKSVAGGKMKETGTTHWHSPNTGDTNESGFSALPVGCRYYNGRYDYMGYNATFWSSTEDYPYSAWYRKLWYNDSVVNRYSTKERNGFSVRCVKD
ncbi:MAG: fibrobacter succinogenes major paralogous domain-containing protein, partial [Candidatus Marinimicrobia bacterium]|nr:fibrobacter succinogenes major paralogous domain-containing protein [bacterium]MCG2714707.1 fibrobacter succinogenes major paralogous domain-containing protein [Candidatus Neomarinimicrobiota bacterium]